VFLLDGSSGEEPDESDQDDGDQHEEEKLRDDDATDDCQQEQQQQECPKHVNSFWGLGGPASPVRKNILVIPEATPGQTPVRPRPC